MWNKYHAQKTELDGIVFDSKKESERYAVLKILERGKVIRDLECQKRFVLLEASENRYGRKERAIYYDADFFYYDVEKGHYVAEDVKGMRTKEYILKRKLFVYNYPFIEFIET